MVQPSIAETFLVGILIDEAVISFYSLEKVVFFSVPKIGTFEVVVFDFCLGNITAEEIAGETNHGEDAHELQAAKLCVCYLLDDSHIQIYV